MRKLTSGIIIFLLTFPPAGFSDDLINAYSASQSKKTTKTSSQTTTSTSPVSVPAKSVTTVPASIEPEPAPVIKPVNQAVAVQFIQPNETSQVDSEQLRKLEEERLKKEQEAERKIKAAAEKKAKEEVKAAKKKQAQEEKKSEEEMKKATAENKVLAKKVQEKEKTAKQKLSDGEKKLTQDAEKRVKEEEKAAEKRAKEEEKKAKALAKKEANKRKKYQELSEVYNRTAEESAKAGQKTEVAEGGKKYEQVSKNTEPVTGQANEGHFLKSVRDLTGLGFIGFSRDNAWRIVPGYKFVTQFDSNINREPPHQQNADIIFNYIPSVEINRTGTRYFFRTGYEMNFEEFLRNGEQNSFNHAAKVKFGYTGSRFTVKMDEMFSHVNTYASSEDSKRRTIMLNELSPEVIYQLTPKVSVSSIYNNRLFSYKDVVLKENNYDTNTIGGRIYYHARPKLTVFLEGAGFDTNYYNSGKYNSNGFTVTTGAEGRLTKKLLTNFKTGFRGNRYDDSTINSYYDWILEGAIQYLINRKSDVTLMAKRDKQESVYRNTAWYQSSFIGFIYNYKLAPKMAISAESNIRHNAYPSEQTEGTLTKKRSDHILETGAMLKWRPVRNLILTLGYHLRERFSNFDNVFDYVSHVVDASISYQFT